MMKALCSGNTLDLMANNKAAGLTPAALFCVPPPGIFTRLTSADGIDSQK
jgi:hypothetical protein